MRNFFERRVNKTSGEGKNSGTTNVHVEGKPRSKNEKNCGANATLLVEKRDTLPVRTRTPDKKTSRARQKASKAVVLATDFQKKALPASSDHTTKYEKGTQTVAKSPAAIAQSNQTLSRVKRKNENHFFVTYNDISQYLMTFLPLEDAIRYSMTCYRLWTKNQDTLLSWLLNKGPTYNFIEGFYQLTELFKLDPFFETHKPVFSRPLPTDTEASKTPVIAVSYFLSCTHSVLKTIVANDPFCGWKVATVCGLGEEVTVSFKDKKKNLYYTFDTYDRGFLEYSSLGGQVHQMNLFIQHAPANTENGHFDLLQYDIKQQAALYGAIGGHVPVLKSLKQRGYNLKRMCVVAKTPEDSETLLTNALTGGNEKTIVFLKDEGCDPNIGKSPAYLAASVGHWKRYAAESKNRSPIRAEHKISDAKILTEYALLKGKLKEAKHLIETYKIEIDEDLLVKIICSGHSEIFWDFVDNGILSLSHKFKCGETVEHLLALKGLLRILLRVSDDKRATNGIAVLDKEGQSILHYTARGDRWDVYCHFKNSNLPEHSNLPEIDKNGITIAHCAAEAASWCFLKHLKQIKSPHLQAKAKDGSTILHSSARSGEPNVMIMIVEEFGIDFRSVDASNNMAVHLLAEAAPQKPQLWNTLNCVLNHFSAYDLLDAANGDGITIRETIIDNKAQAYFTPSCFEEMGDGYSQTF